MFQTTKMELLEVKLLSTLFLVFSVCVILVLTLNSDDKEHMLGQGLVVYLGVALVLICFCLCACIAINMGISMTRERELEPLLSIRIEPSYVLQVAPDAPKVLNAAAG